MKPKKETLYAYSIITEAVSKDSDTFVRDIRQALKSEGRETIEKRRMQLSHGVKDADVLVFSSEGKDFFFGMMMTLTPGNLLGTLPNDAMKEKSININKLMNDGVDITKYKGIYYFALSKTKLICNVSTKQKRLSVYLNWLIDDFRGKTHYRFEPIIREQKEIKLTEVKKILFQSGFCLDLPNLPKEKENNKFAVNIKFDKFLDGLKDLNNQQISRLLRDDIVQATLVFEVKKRPKERSKEDHKKLLACSLATDESITFVDKKGKKIEGSLIQARKEIEVETIDGELIIEEELKQEMESFLIELENNEVS